MTSRNYAIDSVRVIAILFIIMIHTRPFESISAFGNIVNFIIGSFAGFAVPFFFLTSGYFLCQNLQSNRDKEYYKKYIQRIISVYIFGIVINLPIHIVDEVGQALINDQGVLVIQNKIIQSTVFETLIAAANPVKILYYGTPVAGPLWFLPALAYSVSILYLAKIYNAELPVFILSAILHFFGIFGQISIGILNISLQTRDAFFFGVFYVSIGYFINDWSVDKFIEDGWSKKIFISFILFSIIHIFERYLLAYVLGNTQVPISQASLTTGYTFFTVPFSLSLFLYTLSNKKLAKETILPRIGKAAVGIYTIHVAVLTLLRRVELLFEYFIKYDFSRTYIWHITLTPTVFILSLILYIFLGKIGFVDIFFEYKEL